MIRFARLFYACMFATLFAIVDSPRGDYAAEYSGMTKEMISKLEQERGNTIEFVTEKAYDNFVAEKNIRVIDQNREAARRAAAITVKNPAATATQKVDALILLLDLDK